MEFSTCNKSYKPVFYITSRFHIINVRYVSLLNIKTSDPKYLFSHYDDELLEEPTKRNYYLTQRTESPNCT